MNTLLLYVPITDPTSGYHSLSYLTSYAERLTSTHIDIIDTNIKAYNYTFEEKQFNKIMNCIKEKFNTLKNKKQLDGYEQITLLYSWKTESIEYKELKRAQYILKHEEEFYDYMKYSWAVQIMTNWMNALSVLGFPGIFENSWGIPSTGYLNIFSVHDLTSSEILRKLSRPYEDYYNDKLIPYIKEKGYAVIGINVTYTTQLPFALYLASLIRKNFKDIKIIFGGTEVSDVWKYIIKKEYFFEVFNMADVCIIGEGESAFVEVLDKVEKGVKLTSHDNIIVNPMKEQLTIDSIKIKYEDISDLPVPTYEKLDYDDYISPFSYVYYSPSRGCYWGKCAFCDYGLNNEAATSPWRQYSVEKIVQDLKEISKRHKFIYLSVDVLSPSMLLKMAERLVEEKIDIRWGAEVRLEKDWTIERCQLLRDSGCLAISVGYESGNQRVLNLINKGTQIEKVKETINNFSEVGIGVQIMGFTGFPTETFEEAMDSINFLKENREKWILGGLGEFSLTSGARVAKNPKDYKIKNVRPYENEEITWRLFYEEEGSGHGGKLNEDILNKEKMNLSKCDFPRPWVGGNDAAHTYFYLDKYGVDIVNKIDLKRYYQSHKDKKWKINGVIKKNIKGFSVNNLLKYKELEEIANSQMNIGMSYTNREIDKELKKNIIKYNFDSEEQELFIRSDGAIYEFPELLMKFLKRFEKENVLEDIINSYEDKESFEKIAEYCIGKHFLQLK